MDILNPRDLRYGPLLPMDDRRIPIPMARVDVGPPALHAQFHLIPFHAPALYDMVGSDWAWFPIGTWEEMLASSMSWGGDPESTALFQALMGAMYLRMEDASPSQWWALDQAMSTSGTVWEPLGGLEGAARLAWELPGADGSLMLAYTREDMPTLDLGDRIVHWMATSTWPSMAEFQD